MEQWGCNSVTACLGTPSSCSAMQLALPSTKGYLWWEGSYWCSWVFVWTLMYPGPPSLSHALCISLMADLHRKPQMSCYDCWGQSFLSNVNNCFRLEGHLFQRYFDWLDWCFFAFSTAMPLPSQWKDNLLLGVVMKSEVAAYALISVYFFQGNIVQN